MSRVISDYCWIRYVFDNKEKKCKRKQWGTTRNPISLPCVSWVVTNVLISASVVCVYNDSAYRKDCSSGDFSRKLFFSPLPPAWKYCLIVSRATSSTAHCFGDKFFSSSYLHNMVIGEAWVIKFWFRKKTSTSSKWGKMNFWKMKKVLFVKPQKVNLIIFNLP